MIFYMVRFLVGCILILSVSMANSMHEFLNVVLALEKDFDLNRRLMEEIVQRPMERIEYNRFEYRGQDQSRFQLTMKKHHGYLSYFFQYDPMKLHEALKKIRVDYKFKSTLADGTPIYNYEAFNFTIKLIPCSDKGKECMNEARISKYNSFRKEFDAHFWNDIDWIRGEK